MKSLFILFVFLVFFSFSECIQLGTIVKPTNLDEYGYSGCQYVYTLILIDAVNTITILSPTTSQFISNLDGNQKFTITFNQVFGDRGTFSLTAVANQVETTFTLDDFECLEIPPITMSLNQELVYSTNYQFFTWVAKIETNPPMTKHLPGKSCNMNLVSGPLAFYPQYYPINICSAFMTISSIQLNTPTIVNFNPSISQNVNIELNTPYTKDPFEGSIDAIASVGTKSFNFIMNYKDNVNMNPFFLLLRQLPTVQGNQVNGTFIFFINYKGGYYYDFDIDSDYSFSVFENNNQVDKVTLHGTSVKGSQVVYLTDTSGVAAVPSDPNAAYLKMVYTMRSSFYDPRNYNTIVLTNILSKTYVSFPFGYTSGNIVAGYTMSFSYKSSSHFGYNNFKTRLAANAPKTNTNTLPVSFNTQPPIVESFDLIGRGVGKGVYRIIVSDSIELIYGILSNYDESAIVLMGTESVVASDGGHNVTFEFLLNSLSYDLFVYSHVGLYQIVTPPPLGGLFDLQNLRNIVFLVNDVDTTNKVTNNTMMVYYSDPGFIIRLARSTSAGQDIMYFDSVYDTATQAYIIPFIIPPNRMTGNYNYIINVGNPGISCPSEIFDVLFEPLRVRSDNYDDIPPLITAMSVLPSSIVSSVDDFTELAFVVTISDTYNGLLNGSFWITSELDPYGYNITIDPSMADSGDQYLGVYSLKFNVSKLCKTQTYYIQYVKLLDNAFLQSSSYFPYMDPFMVDWSSITITIQCSDPDDSTPPSISGFSILNGTIDTSLEDRVVVIDFSTDDTDLDYSRLPIVYAQEMGFSKTITGVTTIVDQSTGKLRAHINLPYQFGIIGGVYFSVYGFIDHQMNFNGYSNTDLNDLYPSSSSIQTFTTYSPCITSTRGIFRPSSGSVSIYGYNFGTDQSTTITEYTLTVNDDNFQPITSYESLFNSMIIFNRSPSNEPFKVKITKQGTASNIFIVNPIYFDDPPPSSSSSQSSISSQSSSTVSSSQASSANNNNSGSSNVTPQPSICPGKPEQCGGPSKGQCINGECVCKSPYITLDCSSQIIIIPEPSVDPVKPNRNTTTEGNLPNGNKITYESLISIYSLREYNSNSQELINEYKFNTWIFKDISTPQTPSLYHYSTIVNNITTINVTIQWYNQTTNITFANQILTMQPSSLKYRIEIDSYPFQSSFNYLQLVMSASLVSSDNNGACSVSQIGTIDKDEYIQLQVNDHSLYGRFIKRGIVDGKVTSISNTFINSENSGKSSSNLIGMNIPIYKESVSLDPDFSVLIDTKSASDVQGSVCQSLPKKKLSPSQLAGIIIGCVAFAAIIGISTAYYFYKKKQTKHFAKKLGKLNK